MKISLKKPILGALLLAQTLSLPAAAPRYIFYFIGDGMGMGHVITTDTYWRNVLGADTKLPMLQLPVGGIVTTYSASSSVTDSAAAGTALATGQKTGNGMLGVNADSIPVESMAKVLHDDGWGVGLVTTVAPDDATPGAFYAHVPYRRDFYNVGRQAADSGYEFMAGASWRGLKDADGNDTGLLDYILSHEDIDLTTDVAQAASSSKPRVMLTAAKPVSKGNVGYPIDSIKGALTIEEMTAACLAHLERVSPDRFFMMVEGGNIDHVAHGNDGAGVVIETLAFNNALQQAIDFYNRHPEETLIVVTADHETGGMSLGSNVGRYASHMEYVPLQRMSKEQFSKKIKKMLNSEPTPAWEDIKETTRRATGLWGVIPVSEEQEAHLKSLYDRTFVDREQMADQKTLYATFNALAVEIFKVLNDNAGFGWTTTGHSGCPVPVYAQGDGAEIFGTWQDNTEIAPKIMRLAGYQFPQNQQAQ